MRYFINTSIATTVKLANFKFCVLDMSAQNKAAKKNQKRAEKRAKERAQKLKEDGVIDRLIHEKEDPEEKIETQDPVEKLKTQLQEAKDNKVFV
jgi:acetyl-CoA carboxylase alpha subunit